MQTLSLSVLHDGTAFRSRRMRFALHAELFRARKTLCRIADICTANTHLHECPRSWL